MLLNAERGFFYGLVEFRKSGLCFIWRGVNIYRKDLLVIVLEVFFYFVDALLQVDGGIIKAVIPGGQIVISPADNCIFFGAAAIDEYQ